MAEITTAEAVESTCRIIARRIMPDLRYLTESSPWRLKFSDEELRAARLMVEALYRELDSIDHALADALAPPAG